MPTTFEDLLSDLDRLTSNDPELNRASDILWGLYKKKGLTYRELFGSKAFGYVKYIVTATPQQLSITDLDTGEEFHKLD